MIAFIKRHKIIFSFFWLFFTVSLGMWWFHLSLMNTDRLILLSSQLGGSSLKDELLHYERQRTMIVYEGIVFMFMLITGGMTMVWYVYRDTRRNKLIRDFFSTVTHEMKTPLTSLQLQVESLIEDFKNDAVELRLKKILSENNRIERQMNKAFYLASLMRSEPLYLESVSLKNLLETMSWDWKELLIQTDQEYFVRVDKRALESIFKNIFENAIIHGNASVIQIFITSRASLVEIRILDNGTGFKGNINKLGTAFRRHSSTSGSGIGYYIIFNLLKKMRSTISVRNVPQNGFEVLLKVPGDTGRSDA